jgi:effector-binding domain-containing protein
MAIEEPAFTVEFKAEDYEVRKYEAFMVAETKINANFEDAGNKAFKILAAYIFGDNTAKSKIAMTAPVTQKVSEVIAMTAPVTQLKTPDGYLVHFTMPKKYTEKTLPKPNDNRVKIVKIPGRRVAVYKYTGSWSESHFRDSLKKFKAQLEKNKIQTVGEPILARFNSPFQIWFLRRNEIWLDLKI